MKPSSQTFVDTDVEIVTINGVKFLLFDKLVAVPAWKMRELFLRDYARWKREKREAAHVLRSKD